MSPYIGGRGAAANRSDASRVRFGARAALDAWRGKTASSYRGAGPGDIASSPTVLVVDDEPMVRSVMVSALRDHYRVVAAADGLGALDVFRAAEGEITALVTNVAMPKLDGLGLAAELRRLDDPPPILFVSGFTGRDEIPAPFLQKPFDPQALLAAVRQAINSRNE
jgi:CheY-like chemotaxis protein